jgi:hypothetical protein
VSNRVWVGWVCMSMGVSTSMGSRRRSEGREPRRDINQPSVRPATPLYTPFLSKRVKKGANEREYDDGMRCA